MLEVKHRRFAFIGGLALQRWGEPRVTQDVDATVFTGFSGEDEFINDMLNAYQPRVENAGEFARNARVLLLKSASGIGIDIALGGLSFEEEMIGRSTEYDFLPGIRLRTCSAEDLIIMKAFAARDRDWADIRTVLVRQVKIDFGYIMENLTPLVELKEQPEILDRLNQLIDETKP
ncbi:MAG: nucleotidyl transferase AbiEii/AbiGii toxin family protein [Myxococcales bacterium]|nr:nucleotidyl transferase AbiEii/AbiGii toxin family protein [Myxococcales bacterium]